MWFEIDADGIKVKLQITGYTLANKDNWDSAPSNQNSSKG